jgi:hypothetical protein
VILLLSFTFAFALNIYKENHYGWSLKEIFIQIYIDLIFTGIFYVILAVSRCIWMIPEGTLNRNYKS